jgi:hypothetical protein
VPESSSLTVDAALRRRMVTDLWRHNLRTLRGLGILRYVGAGAVVLLLWHTVVGALVVAGVLLLGRMGWWWARLTWNLTRRLPIGQVVHVGHTRAGELVVRDTDEVWLPRGSANSVQRIGSVTVIHGRAVGAIVPTALLTDEDAAFLEGHGALPQERPATDEALPLPLSVELSKQVQDDMVEARRRSYLRSGELSVVVALPVLLFVTTVFIAKPQTTLVVTAACCIPIAFSLNGMQRSCAALRRAYPVGHTLRARADEDGLALTLVHSTLRVHWTDYEAHRMRARTVELRTRKGRPLGNLTLPSALFTADALHVLRSAVPKSF